MSESEYPKNVFEWQYGRHGNFRLIALDADRFEIEKADKDLMGVTKWDRISDVGVIIPALKMGIAAALVRGNAWKECSK